MAAGWTEALRTRRQDDLCVLGPSASSRALWAAGWAQTAPPFPVKCSAMALELVTRFLKAADQGDETALAAFLAQDGGVLDAADSAGSSALPLAASRGHKGTVRLLMKARHA